MVKKAPSRKAQEARKPLDAFVHHQVQALEETGKAFVSLLPKDFREHAGNALNEARTSWEVLFDGVIDTLESGMNKLRRKPKEAPRKDKVKVDVE